MSSESGRLVGEQQFRGGEANERRGASCRSTRDEGTNLPEDLNCQVVQLGSEIDMHIYYIEPFPLGIDRTPQGVHMVTSSSSKLDETHMEPLQTTGTWCSEASR